MKHMEAELDGIAAHAAEMMQVIPLTGRRASISANLIGSIRLRMQMHLTGQGGSPISSLRHHEGLDLYLQSPNPRRFGRILFEMAIRFYETIDSYGPPSAASEAAKGAYDLILQAAIDEFRENHPDAWDVREAD